MRIAVIGAGVSGLVAAHLLHRAGHDVSRSSRPRRTPAATRTPSGSTSRTARCDVDTGFIVFNDRNYPNFERLLDRLGVASQPSDMSFGVGDEDGDFEYASTSANGAVRQARATSSRPAFHRMVVDVLRFQREARDAAGVRRATRRWRSGCASSALQRARSSSKLIVPQAAAVWSADPAQMWTFPARFLVEFFDNHGMLDLSGRPQWRAVRVAPSATSRR